MTVKNEDFLAEFTDEEFDAMGTEELREASDRAELWTRHETVATLPVGAAEVVGTSGALTVLDKTIQTLLKAFEGRGGRINADRYNRSSVEIHAYHGDDYLRDELKRSAERARERRDAEVNAGE